MITDAGRSTEPTPYDTSWVLVGRQIAARSGTAEDQVRQLYPGAVAGGTPMGGNAGRGSGSGDR